MTDNAPSGLPPLPQLQLTADPTKFVGASIKRQRLTSDGYSNHHYCVVDPNEVVLGMMVANVPSMGNYNHQTGRNETVYSPELIFIVARHPDEALQQALRTAQDARSHEERAVEGRRKIEGAIEIAKKQIDELTKQLAAAKATNASQEDSILRATTSLRKMEGDLSKVRAYMGDKAFKEAVSS